MRFWVLIFFLLIYSHINASESVVIYDSSHIEVRTPSEKTINELQNNPELRYEEIQQEGNTILDYILYYIRKFLQMFFSDEGVMPLVRYVLIALFLAFVIYQLTKNKLQWVFAGKSQTSGLIYDIMEENLNAHDFDKLIAEELAKGNYRIVVRLYYLKVLKTLDKKELINWQQNKTNRSYYYDLIGSGLEGRYQQLTWIYENIWYGNFAVQNDYFRFTEKEFKELYKAIEEHDG